MSQMRLAHDPDGIGAGTNGAAPPMESWRVALRPVHEHDLTFLYDLSTSGDTAWRWRQRGTTPSPQVFADQLFAGVLTQFIIVDRKDERRLGLVVAYRAEHRNGHAYLGIVVRPDCERRGLAFEALALFIDYLFRLWNFRKLYAEGPEFAFAQFGSAFSRYLEEEGRLQEHYYHDGRYWSYITAALYRERWNRERGRLLRGILKKWGLEGDGDEIPEAPRIGGSRGD